jgi:hypothetical protein
MDPSARRTVGIIKAAMVAWSGWTAKIAAEELKLKLVRKIEQARSSTLASNQSLLLKK